MLSPFDSRNETWNGEFSLHPIHHESNAEAKPQVDEGSGRESLKGFGSVCFNLTRSKRELPHADGHGQRGILEKVQGFIRNGRNDETKGNGDDNETIGLGNGKAHGQA